MNNKSQVIKYDKGITAITADNVKTYRTLTVHELLACINTIVNKSVTQ